VLTLDRVATLPLSIGFRRLTLAGDEILAGPSNSTPAFCNGETPVVL
jgi:hypothetical protein